MQSFIYNFASQEIAQENGACYFSCMHNLNKWGRFLDAGNSATLKLDLSDSKYVIKCTKNKSKNSLLIDINNGQSSVDLTCENIFIDTSKKNAFYEIKNLIDVVQNDYDTSDYKEFPLHTLNDPFSLIIHDQAYNFSMNLSYTVSNIFMNLSRKGEGLEWYKKDKSSRVWSRRAFIIPAILAVLKCPESQENFIHDLKTLQDVYRDLVSNGKLFLENYAQLHNERIFNEERQKFMNCFHAEKGTRRKIVRKMCKHCFVFLTAVSCFIFVKVFLNVELPLLKKC